MTSILSRPLTRRRALFIGAVLGGAAMGGRVPGARASTVQRWRGQALGAHATIELVGASPERSADVFKAVEAEIARLETIFSLYRADSDLVRLNGDGVLAAPKADFLALLSEARAAYEMTGGLFDPTVQPVFALYARHFSAPGASPDGPPKADLAAALARVGFEHVSFDEDEIRFARRDMALTLNGIAQGFVTDKVADLLKAQGFGNILLDIGEIRAIGRGRDGDGWAIGIDGRTEVLHVSDMAVATSAPFGTVLDSAGRFGHIFDPKRGFVAGEFRQATVIADRAARADALSTAAVLMDRQGPGRLEAMGLRVIAG